ncbi:MAG: NIPSNAP family protein [Bacteroidales bacterium]
MKAKTVKRRDFLKSSAALAVVAGVDASARVNLNPDQVQEFYELRIYEAASAEKKAVLDTYLQNALIPAFGRMGIDRIGAFTNLDEPEDLSVFLLIPYPTLAHFADVNPKLLADKAYQEAARDYFSAPKEEPVFVRIHSRFYKAFAGMPVIELPAQTAGREARMFELRIYESHTEEKAARKVDMFNSGEIDVMRETELAPVFFGEGLIGNDVPHLAYMLSAPNREAHESHWGFFGAHPEWKRMSSMEKYKDTVSKITNYFLVPTAYSQI